MKPDNTKFSNTADWADALIDTLRQQRDAVSEDELAVLQAQCARLRDDVPCPAPNPGLPAIVRKRQELARVAESLSEESAVAIQLETSRRIHHSGEVVGVGLATADATYYVPVGHRFEESKELLPDQITSAEAADVLRLDRLPLIAHDAKWALKWLRRHTAVAARFIWDTMIAARLLRSDLPAGLQEAATRELDVPDWSLPVKDRGRVQFLPIERVAVHCGKDAQYTLALYERQKTCLA